MGETACAEKDSRRTVRSCRPVLVLWRRILLVGYPRQGEACHVEAENDCFQQVSRMTESYNKSLRLYAQVSSKFNELDESYDLDTLAALQGKKPKEYENLRCSTDLDGRQAEGDVFEAFV